MTFTVGGEVSGWAVPFRSRVPPATVSRASRATSLMSPEALPFSATVPSCLAGTGLSVESRRAKRSASFTDTSKLISTEGWRAASFRTPEIVPAAPAMSPTPAWRRVRVPFCSRASTRASARVMPLTVASPTRRSILASKLSSTARASALPDAFPSAVPEPSPDAGDAPAPWGR